MAKAGEGNLVSPTGSAWNSFVESPIRGELLEVVLSTDISTVQDKCIVVIDVG